MPVPILRYPLDTTGVNVNNAVIGELHTLTANNVRAIAPTYGPFFTESLVVFDAALNTTLSRGVDYQCVELLQDASLLTGKEVCCIILIKNPAVSNTARINYQCLGAEYQNSAAAVISLYETVIQDNRPVDWANVINKPFEFNPALHNHLLEDIYGFQAVVSALERVRNAVILSDVPAFEFLIDWLLARLTDMDSRYAGALAHLTDYANPHQTNKAQVGLSLVSNFAALTVADIDTIFSTVSAQDKYITLFTLKRILSLPTLGTPLEFQLMKSLSPGGYKIVTTVTAPGIKENAKLFWSISSNFTTPAYFTNTSDYGIVKDGKLVFTTYLRDVPPSPWNETFSITVKNKTPNGEILGVGGPYTLEMIEPDPYLLETLISWNDLMMRDILEPGVPITPGTLFLIGSRNNGLTSKRWASWDINAWPNVLTNEEFVDLSMVHCMFKPGLAISAASYFLIENPKRL